LLQQIYPFAGASAQDRAANFNLIGDAHFHLGWYANSACILWAELDPNNSIWPINY
jgi:hypothetical protein